MINMYNEAIANPIYEIDPNISEDIFMAWEPSVHGSWEDFIKTDNIRRVADAGADTFVAGSAIFGKPDYKSVIDQMRASLAADGTGDGAAPAAT